MTSAGIKRHNDHYNKLFTILFECVEEHAPESEPRKEIDLDSYISRIMHLETDEEKAAYAFRNAYDLASDQLKQAEGQPALERTALEAIVALCVKRCEDLEKVK